jgi:glucose-6-phosphate isomerase
MRSRALTPATPLYTTESWLPLGETTDGALAWGNTTLFPGRVGSEYFMTRGHWHRKRHLGELVICVSGAGSLVLMNDARETRIETLTPGSTHHVPGHTAHRTVNTGDAPLVFLCAWVADCGHDYEDIRERGFSRVLVEVGGVPTLVSRT